MPILNTVFSRFTVLVLTMEVIAAFHQIPRQKLARNNYRELGFLNLEVNNSIVLTVRHNINARKDIFEYYFYKNQLKVRDANG